MEFILGLLVASAVFTIFFFWYRDRRDDEHRVLFANRQGIAYQLERERENSKRWKKAAQRKEGTK